MEKNNLYFDYRDLLKAPALGWSFRKLVISFKGIFLSWMIYILFGYAAIFSTPLGRQLGLLGIFRYFEFFPDISRVDAGFISNAIYFIGIILSVFYILLTAMKVSKIAFEDLKGNSVYQISDAAGFAKKHSMKLLMSISILGIGILIFLLGMFVSGFIGKIPLIGEILVSIVTIPLILWSMLYVVLIILFLFGLNLIPAIVTVIEDDVIETLLQLFSIFIYKPVKLIVYEVFSRIVILFYAFILTVIASVSVVILNLQIGSIIGYSWAQIMTVAFYRVPFLMDTSFGLNILVAISRITGFPFIIDISSMSIGEYIAGLVMGVSLFVIFLGIFSFIFSCVVSSQVIIYLILRKQKDKIDMRDIVHSEIPYSEIPEKI